MKITKEQLRRVVQEEIENVMNEAMPKVAQQTLKSLGALPRGSKSKGRDDELTQVRMQNLFKTVKDIHDRLAKIEQKIGLRGMPIAKGLPKSGG
jgi:molecular chaperone GrpE (heat shock protein)